MKNKKVRERRLKALAGIRNISRDEKILHGSEAIAAGIAEAGAVNEPVTEQENEEVMVQTSKELTDQTRNQSTQQITDQSTDETRNQPTEQTSSQHSQQTSSQNSLQTLKSPQLYSCPKCGDKFSKKPYANIHCRKPKPSWKCEKCGVVIKHSCNIKRHKRSCLKAKKSGSKEQDMGNLTCEECGKQFMKIYNVVRHMKLVHDISTEKKLKCLVMDCGFSTDNEKQLKKHTTVMHVGTSLTVQCKQCQHSCRSLSGLRYHMATIHGTACPVCDKLFSTEARKESHMKTVHTENCRSVERNVGHSSHIVVCRKIGEHAIVVVPHNNNGTEPLEDVLNDEQESVK